MKRLFYSLLMVMLAMSGASGLNAVNKLQPKQFIDAELTIRKDNFSHKFKVPVVSRLKERPPSSDQFMGGEYAITGGCPKDLGCEYRAVVSARTVADDRSVLEVQVSFKDRRECDAVKELIVVRGKRAEARMKCGVRVKAGYSL
jgi:hypothetical protein